MLTQEQLESRKNFICGSDASVICGLNPYKTKLALWMEKTGLCEQDDIGHLNHIKFGNYMEQGVADWFCAETGKKVLPNTGEMLIKDFMAGNVDFIIDGENAILECKTAYNDEGWGNEENVIPAHYLLQVAHYCMVGDFDRAYIAVVFAQKREMRWYTYDRNKTLEEKLYAQEKDFWENNVKPVIAPEPTTSNDVILFFKETESNPVSVNSEITNKYNTLLEIQQNIKSLEKQEKDLKEEIKLYMKNHDTLVDECGKIIATWKYIKAREMLDIESLKKELPDIYDQYLKESTKTTRRFNLK